jgi:hypothetical protein
LEDLENYTENTVSSELYLQLEILKIRDSVIEGLLSHLGKAKGIVTLLRGLPHLHSVTKESVIPDQLLAQVTFISKNYCIYADPFIFSIIYLKSNFIEAQKYQTLLEMLYLKSPLKQMTSY